MEKDISEPWLTGQNPKLRYFFNIRERFGKKLVSTDDTCQRRNYVVKTKEPDQALLQDESLVLIFYQIHSLE
jgi:hypothetical protein